MKKDIWSGFNKEDLELFKTLNTPRKIQDYINSIPANFEHDRETCYSPLQVLRMNRAHCMEGAMLAACILRFHGFKPLVLDLETIENDFDHVVTVFQVDGFWGSISKTNHAVLRYREPIYSSIRELVMSFFHEYFLNSNGLKTLRRYSNPVNLSKFDKQNWMTSDSEVWYIPEYLEKVKHLKILNKKQISNLRPADKIEIEAGKITEYQN